MKTRRVDWRAAAAAAISWAACLGPAETAPGIGASRAYAQGPPVAPATPAPAGPAAPPADAPAGPSTVETLSARYRLTERYALAPDPAAPEVLTQYQVATRETLRTMVDRPQGAPERSETVYQVVYTERPAKITGPDGVTDTVRRYDAFRMKSAQGPPPSKTPPLQNLTVWHQAPPGRDPRVFSLTEGRSLREWEYHAISSQVFLPQLVTLIPATPKRVGDTWRIPRNAAKALLGVMPEADGYELIGTLQEVRKGSPSQAILSVSGHVLLELGPTAVNAQLVFTFDPRPAPAPADAVAKTADGTKGADAGAIEARGSIDEIRMALAVTTPLPESEGRLKETRSREVIVGRRRSPATSPPLTVPATEPDAASLSSWLIYDDPEGQFHFRHPQSLRLLPGGPVDPDEVTLFNHGTSGLDVFTIRVRPPIKDTAKDRQALDPDFHRKQLDEEWQRQKQDVLKGPREWLPDAEWAPLKRKVYRIEAALKPKGDPKAQRIYLDYYLVVFERNRSLVVEAMTAQDPHIEFRNQAEETIKSFDFGTSDGSPAPAPRERPGRPATGTEKGKAAAPGTGKAAGPGDGPRAAPKPKAEQADGPSPFPP